VRDLIVTARHRFQPKGLIVSDNARELVQRRIVSARYPALEKSSAVGVNDDTARSVSQTRLQQSDKGFQFGVEGLFRTAAAS
jgi:hypothetical protein